MSSIGPATSTTAQVALQAQQSEQLLSPSKAKAADGDGKPSPLAQPDDRSRTSVNLLV